MRPSTQRVAQLTQALRAEGPLFGGQPLIGRFQCKATSASRGISLAVRKPDTSVNSVKRWQSGIRIQEQTRAFSSSARYRNPQNPLPGGPGATPKRSNAAPLLGVLFGASTLAIVGSTFISHVDTREDDIKSDNGVNITDAEGMCLACVFSSLLHFSA